MRRFFHLVGILCLVGAGIVVFNNLDASAQQGDALVRCRFDPPSINKGAETTVYLEVIDVVDLYAYQLEMAFDSDQVDVYGSPQDPQDDRMVLGDFLSNDFEVYNEIHNEFGTILMAMTQFDPSPPQSGSGELAHGYVSGDQDGTLDFIFEEVILMNPDSEEIPHRQENCALIIGSGGQVAETPTETAIPPSDTPVPTSTFTPTETQPTPGNTLTPEPTFTSSPTETTQPNLSATPQPSETTTHSPTAQISETPTLSPTSVPSDIPTIGFSPTPLPSIVITTETPNPSRTPTVTVSPTVTATGIPEPIPRPFNSMYVVLCLTFCIAMFAVIAVLAGVLWYIGQSR